MVSTASSHPGAAIFSEEDDMNFRDSFQAHRFSNAGISPILTLSDASDSCGSARGKPCCLTDEVATCSGYLADPEAADL